MDKLTTYRTAIKTILEQYYQISQAQPHLASSEEVSDRLAFDDTHDHYLWFRFGWEDKKLVQHIIIYLSIKHDKIWVEQDNTDRCVVDDLLAAGIPAEDIVLAFHPPGKRALTEFAIA
jgi:hypothetical protein